MGARAATAAVFLVAGTVFGSWAAQLPAIKARLGLSDAGLSVALFSLEAGAVFGLSLGGRFVSRWGSRSVPRWSTPLFATLFVWLGWHRTSSCSPPERRCSPPPTVSSTWP